jgi:ArsR family transcriptional regulator, zinc-responsive transcriptional repressor
MVKTTGKTKQRGPDLVPMDALDAAAECLRALAHPARLRMIDILQQGEYPVHAIAAMCGTGPNQTCEHLRMLKGHGILDSRRQGRTVYYRIRAPHIPGLLACIRAQCGARPLPTTPNTKGTSR